MRTINQNSRRGAFQIGIVSPMGDLLTSPPSMDITIPANAPDPADTLVFFGISNLHQTLLQEHTRS
ncbi:MAG: hypothetical protein L0H53_11395 [Candidatus Nitrosocosmicus sp.]|nr:hypothetical protein [Candidatus Nitrosocosmicus sp.]MDN5868155.1 hypothetical protein [Candidatus Nitrosocosmicus sp.]